jgi:hypothetical protein
VVETLGIKMGEHLIPMSNPVKERTGWLIPTAVLCKAISTAPSTT